MKTDSVDIPLPHLAIGLIGLLASVLVGAALGAWLGWSPTDWRYIAYTAITIPAVVLFILWPALRAQRPGGERRRA